MERWGLLLKGLIVLFVIIGFCHHASADERYTVKAGDSLSGIARTFRVSLEALKKANGLEGDHIRPKQVLLVPTLREKQADGEAQGAATAETYVVKQGDTLFAISNRTGLPLEPLKQLNNLKTSVLKPGQILVLRKGQVNGEEEEETGDVAEVASLPAPEKEPKKEEATEPLGKWSNPEERSLFVKVAMNFLGVPYRLGGSTLKGMDCSAFVKKIYSIFDIRLPRTAREQGQVGKTVTKDDLKEGDLVFFSTRRVNNSHVGIYIGNGEFVHASSRSREVKIDKLDMPYFHKHFFRGVRVKELETDS